MGFWPLRGGGSSWANNNETSTPTTSKPPFPWPYPHPPLGSVSLPPSSRGRCDRSDDELRHMIPHIIHDLRRMAVAAVGIPPPTHSTSAAVSSWADTYLYSPRTSPLIVGPDVPQIPTPSRDHPPLFPPLGRDLDDAALHFRCGDLMGSYHPSYGFMNYDAYARHISPYAFSVGIVTTPFGAKGQMRTGTERSAPVKNACRRVAEGLRKYLEERFPRANVTIRNGPEETVVTSYVRLILANQTVAGMGYFGVFPALATFGTGYVRRPDFAESANHWVKDVSLSYPHVVLFDAKERLMAANATKWRKNGKWDEIFRFFQGGGGNASGA
mmetsp:Transcript_9269/g.27943  ORF Transcript_9269/g.27943 Transcript_9269/m.27943 type:complete len:327 (-) Transcript_9269:487-1467(-)